MLISMIRRGSGALVCVLLLLGPGAAFAAGQASAPLPPTSQKAESGVARAVRELGDDDAAVRAHARLVALNFGGEAWPEIEAALSSPAVSPSARSVLQSAAKRIRPRFAKLEEIRNHNEFSHRTLLEAWAKDGRKTPETDAIVRRGIDQFMNGYTVSSRAAAHASFVQAIREGCKDPLVLYLEARSFADLPASGHAEVVEHARSAVGAMLASDYDALRKFRAVNHCYFVSSDPIPECSADTLLEWGEKAAQVPGSNYEVGLAFEKLTARLTKEIGREAAINRVIPVYKRACPHDWQPSAFEGYVLIQWAWDARGSGWASTVTPQGWKLFRERIDQAEKTLLESWRIRPGHAYVCEQMVTIAMTRSDREMLEKWFRLGIDADPDDYQLCENKLYALMPRWMGSYEEMFGFARECAASQNYYGELPKVLVDAHLLVGSEFKDQKTYFHRPEVWEDGRKVYEESLKLFPIARTRNDYTLWAARCGRWKVVKQQIDLLGDKLDPAVFGGKDEVAKMRARAEHEATLPTTER